MSIQGPILTTTQFGGLIYGDTIFNGNGSTLGCTFNGVFGIISVNNLHSRQ